MLNGFIVFSLSREGKNEEPVWERTTSNGGALMARCTISAEDKNFG
ncbi:hypothetical protein [Pantoea ananatis]|jgi:hypothetical protein|nr:hypothetical protein [Pantoea ananatis]